MTTETAKIIKWLRDTTDAAKRRGRGSIAVPTAYLDALLADRERAVREVELIRQGERAGRKPIATD